MSEREREREVGAMEGNIRGIVIYFKKIPSEMDVAPRYTLLALFTLITLFMLFILFKLLYTALTVACTPIYVHLDREGWNGLRSC